MSSSAGTGRRAWQQVRGEHLAVARRAEQAAEPLELRRQLSGAGPRDYLAERPQGRAQPRVATRIWWTASGSSARTIGSSEASAPAWMRR